MSGWPRADRIQGSVSPGFGKGRDAGLYGVLHHPHEVVDLVLTVERELLAANAC
jgi:hypothetical protein